MSSTAFSMAKFGRAAAERKNPHLPKKTVDRLCPPQPSAWQNLAGLLGREKILICQRKLWTDCVLHSLQHGKIWPGCWGEKKSSFAKENCGQTVSSTAFSMAKFGRAAGERKNPHLPKKTVDRLCPPQPSAWQNLAGLLQREKILICQRKLWTDCVLHSLQHGKIWPGCWGGKKSSFAKENCGQTVSSTAFSMAKFGRAAAERKNPHLPKKTVDRLCPPQPSAWQNLAGLLETKNPHIPRKMKSTLRCTVLLLQDFSLNRQYLRYPGHVEGAEAGQKDYCFTKFSKLTRVVTLITSNKCLKKCILDSSAPQAPMHYAAGTSLLSFRECINNCEHGVGA